MSSNDDNTQDAKLEMVGKLAGGIAHDFNNLLGVIMTYASFVLKALDTQEEERRKNYQEMRSDISEILFAAEKGSELSRQLLVFSRRGRSQPRPTTVCDPVERIMQVLQRTMREDTSLTLQVDEGQKWLVMADPGQIEQVVMNLVFNAKEAHAATIVVTIYRCECDETAPVPPGKYVKLVVVDDGDGMSNDIAQKILEPFYTTKEDGTGLGLNQVYGIMRQGEGHVDVASTEGQGTEISCYFPYIGLATNGNGESVIDQETASLIKGRKILVAEDDPAMREICERTLKSKGAIVQTARHGIEALSVLNHFIPELLVTDLIMPYMSGTVLAERVQERHPEIIVLFVTGYSDEDVENLNVLDKPFTPDQLLHRVEASLQSSPV